MKLVDLKSGISLPIVVIYLSAPFSIVPAQESSGQENKRIGAFGRLFKKRTVPAPAPNQTPGSTSNSQAEKGPDRPIETPKTQALKAAVLSVLPGDRHYRETLATAIDLAYQQRNYKNLWNHRQMPDRLFRGLAFHLSRHGLPEMMALDAYSLASRLRGAPVNNRDLGYTIAIADAGALVRLGGVSPSAIWSDWNTGDVPGLDRKNAKSIAEDLLRATHQRNFDPGVAVDTLAPKNWVYRELQNGYVASRRALSSGAGHGSSGVPDPASAGLARPGLPYLHAPALAGALVARGYLNMPEETRRSLRSVTPQLTEGIKAFQRAHGLTADGVLGPGTWRYLNANPQDHYRARVLNLHRARILPDDFGKKYLIVNIPSAELFGFESGKHAMTMRIVHGKYSKEDFHTPIFRDVMREVVFAPYWNVPESISVTEIFPKLEEDPSYLERNHYEIVRNFRSDAEPLPFDEDALAKIGTGELFLRQKPTGANALGKVKFLFPNKFNVYLHDTPSKQYFSRSDRAQSHGCVRIADPSEMAKWTLRWDEEKVSTALTQGERLSQAVAEPVNVYVTYLTCFPRPVKGRFVLSEAKDVYNKDDKDAQTLNAFLP